VTQRVVARNTSDEVTQGVIARSDSDAATPERPPIKRVLWVLAIFGALIALLAVGLTLNPREVPSPLIGKPAPDFTLAQLHEPQKSFSPHDMSGKVWLLNVWASWCVSCREEHPVLTELAKTGVVPL